MTGPRPAEPTAPAGPRERWGLPLRAWLVLSYLVVLALPLLAFVLTGALAMDLIRQTRLNLENQGELAALFIGERLQGPGAPADVSSLGPTLSPTLQAARERTLAGIRILDARGVVVASSGAGVGVDLSEDPEVAIALTGQTGIETRPRPASRQQQPLASASRRARVRLFVAKPIFDQADAVVGVVLLSRTPREELQALYHMSPRLLWGMFFALALTLAIAGLAGYYGSRSLRRLAQAARLVSLGQRLEPAQIERSARSRVVEVRELARAVASMTEKLQARVDYINEFAGNVSHEFRTPLATLRGTAELLHDDEDMPPAQRKKFLVNAQRELDRMERLVAGLLGLARAERTHARARLSLAELLAALGERRPAVTIEATARADAHVLGNREQLAAVLDNLVDNALTHGGPEVRVTVSTWSNDHHVGFVVRDDGGGISAANLPRIFERFFTTNRGRGGTGLGLPLVRLICQTHGGDIELTSEPGVRTEARVTLPRAGAQDD